MKKILLISQYFSFIDQSSTAISINSRINGIIKDYDITAYCFSNPKCECNHNQHVEIINCDYPINMKSNDMKMEYFKKNAFEYITNNYKDYDLIIVHSNYFATNKLIKEIKEFNKEIKVLAYMPDPYIGGPLKDLDLDYKYKVKCEYEAYYAADKVIVTNEYFKAHMCDYYPEMKDKIIDIYHSYENREYKHENSLNFVFLGTLYLGRRIDNVLMAFDELITENKNYQKFTVISSINDDADLVKTIKNIKNKENFKFINGRIPFKEAEKIELGAYALINIALPLNSTNIDPYFPTKLAQYFKANKPVISISDNPGLSKKLMEITNNYYSKNNVADIKVELKRLIETQHERKINKEVLKKFNNKYTSIRFKEVIDNVINKEKL